MSSEKKQWDRLISINQKACSAINNIKRLGSANESDFVELSLEELYEIASLTGNHATILMRQIKSKEGNHDTRSEEM